MEKVWQNKKSLVSLLKTIIMENKKLDFFETLFHYQGDNEELLKFQDKLQRYGPSGLYDYQKQKAWILLSDEVEGLAFPDEKTVTPISDLIDKDRNLQNLVINLGVDAYDDIIRKNYKYLFDEFAKLHSVKISIGKPSDEWVKRNKQDLERFESLLGEDRLKQWVKPIKGTTTFTKPGTIEKAIEEIKSVLNDVIGFVENGEWSIVNKINSNYRFWAYLISDYDKKNLLGNGSAEDRIKNFFSLKKLSDVCEPTDLEHINQVEKIYGISIEKISYALYEVYKDASKNYRTALSKVSMTTAAGNSTESRFKGEVKLFAGLGDNDIIDFSSPGNQVDTNFGIDMMMRLPNTENWTPIQVKTKEPAKNSNVRIFQMNIGGFLVFPKNRGWIYRKESGGEDLSFEKDFYK